MFDIPGKVVKPKCAKLPPLDLTAVVIRDAVPIPPRERGNNGPSHYQALLAKLQPGQMVELADGYAKSLASAAKKHKVPLAFRKLEGGMVGIWRLPEVKA